MEESAEFKFPLKPVNLNPRTRPQNRLVQYYSWRTSSSAKLSIAAAQLVPPPYLIIHLHLFLFNLLLSLSASSIIPQTLFGLLLSAAVTSHTLRHRCGITGQGPIFRFGHFPRGTLALESLASKISSAPIITLLLLNTWTRHIEYISFVIGRFNKRLHLLLSRVPNNTNDFQSRCIPHRQL